MMQNTDMAGLPQRPAAYAHILVDSMDRYKGGAPEGDGTAYVIPTTSANWTLTLPGYTSQGYFTRLVATQINFQYNLPTIIAGYNNLMQIAVFNGTTYAQYNIPIGTGFYNPTELADAIETELNDTLGTFGVWTVSFENGVFHFEGPVLFFFVQPSFNNSQASLNAQRFRETVGLLNLNGPVDAPAVEFFGCVPTMLPTRFIDLVSSRVSTYQKVKDISSLPNNRVSNVIARIYLQAPNTSSAITATSSPGMNPFNILIDFNNPKYVCWSPNQSVANLDFQLVDDYGNQLPFQDSVGRIVNCEYQLTILATET